MSIAEKLTTIAENEQKVHEAGKKQGVYDAWDVMQPAGRKSYVYAFAGWFWTDQNYKPVRTIDVTSNAQNMFQGSEITDTKVAINLATNGRVGNASYAFAGAKHLVTIRELIVNKYTYTQSQFDSGNKKLANILKVTGQIGGNDDGDRDVNMQWLPLTPASMKNVILALSDVSGMAHAHTRTVNFSEDCWAALEADSTAPDGSTWREYVTSLGWNT